MSNWFSEVKQAPLDPILGLTAVFQADSRKEKINLSAGVYRTETLTVPILSSVKESEKLLLEREVSKNYLPIGGDPDFLEETSRLVLGNELYQDSLGLLSLVQTIGGSGGLYLGGELVRKELGCHSIHISDPSWPNHKSIFKECGFEIFSYPYYDLQKKEISFASMITYLSSLSPKSLVLFHVNCHNPTGSDLSKEQWDSIADICLEKGLIPFFDAAYLGFNDSFEGDCFPIRLFVKKKIEFLLSVSFSKNFTLYAERVGLLMVFSSSASAVPVLSELKRLIRASYSNPPIHGAKIIAMILKTPFLKKMWEEEVFQMKHRILQMRNVFVEELSIKKAKKNYSFILDKKGLFSLCDLSKQQVDLLIQDHAIYLTSDGRINIGGLSFDRISYIVNAIIAVGG